MEESYIETDCWGLRIVSRFGPHLLIQGSERHLSRQNLQGGVCDV